MGRKDRGVERLKRIPTDFTWQELITVLKGLGYREVQGSGSRVKLDNGDPQHLISLHRPHPGNIVKRYALRQVVQKLEQAGLI